MKTFHQAAAIVVIALIAGLGSNAVRSNGIPVFSPASLESQANASQENPLRVSLEKAAKLHKKEKAVFIDARPSSVYRKGHIKGALNIPWQMKEQYFEALEKIPADKPVVAYCDGEACDSSDNLARLLKDLGYEKARSLHNGWSRWKEKGLPKAEENLQGRKG